MIKRLAKMKQELSELATVLNEFKSEAVQLRILDLVFGKEPLTADAGRLDEDNPALRVWSGPPRKKIATGQVPGRRKRGAVGTGAKLALDRLLPGNFFDQPRTINDIIGHCNRNLARTFKANEFSGKLSRIVRDGQLTRTKNANKQYEYKKP